MSKGMWTKHFTPEGKPFYFNAAQSRSVWRSPPDSIIHEAPNLKKPELSVAMETEDPHNQQHVLNNAAVDNLLATLIGPAETSFLPPPVSLEISMQSSEPHQTSVEKRPEIDDNAKNQAMYEIIKYFSC
jgi:hypothetical protein